jgi:hypothetical protein
MSKQFLVFLISLILLGTGLYAYRQYSALKSIDSYDSCQQSYRHYSTGIYVRYGNTYRRTCTTMLGVKFQQNPTYTDISRNEQFSDNSMRYVALSKEFGFTIDYPAGWYQESGKIFDDHIYMPRFSVIIGSKPETNNGWYDYDPEKDFGFAIEVNQKDDLNDNSYSTYQEFIDQKEGSSIKFDNRIITLKQNINLNGVQALDIERVPGPGFEGGGYYIREIIFENNGYVYKIQPFSGFGGASSGLKIYNKNAKLFTSILSTFRFTNQ